MKRINRDIYLQCIQELDQAKYSNNNNTNSIANSQQLGYAKQQQQSKRGFLSGLVTAAMQKKQEVKEQAQDLAAIAKLKAEEAHAELQQAVATEKAAVEEALKT